MTWVILSILFALVIAASVLVLIGGTGDSRFWAAVTGGIAVVLWVVISVAMSVHTVGQRQIGIVYNFSGTISGSKNPGVITTMPWQHIQHANVGVLREDFRLDENNSAVSQDQQPIYADLALNYQVEPRNIINLYKTVGPSWKQILLDSRVLQDFKEVTAQYTAAQITTKRPQLRQDTKERLAIELAKYDIKVVDFFVSNLGYTQSYRDAINSKNVQVQQALQAQAKVAQATAEAEQTVATARGDAQSLLVKAHAEAQSLVLKGRAVRNNPQAVQVQAIDKLSPNVQVIMVPTGSNFLLPNLTGAGK